ncbi:MAG: HD domain-containing protein, partial [Crenarchaeota archaeon]|nr:HD domain-containing protein [Thermoproteota archaeon]
MLKYSKQVRDPVLGWIWLTEDEVKFVDGCAFIQRLRYVNQLGLAHLVYPTARHTRFEHSLGVVHLVTKIFQVLVERDLAKKIISNLLEELNLRDQGFSYILQNLRIAALLHDIGHYPFSHSLENYLAYLLVRELESREDLRRLLSISDEVLSRLREIALSLYVAKEHELITYMLLTYNEDLIKIIREELPNIDINLVKDILFIKVFNKILRIGATLESMKNDLQRVREYSKNVLRALKLLNSSLSSTLDADRVDYMLRDLYFTGASVSTNITLGDVERILANMKIVERDSEDVLIAFNEKARPSLEGFIIARYNLYKWVYLHHKVTLMSTLMRILYNLLIKNLEELGQLDL